jgi:hypothetical protein
MPKENPPPVFEKLIFKGPRFMLLRKSNPVIRSTSFSAQCAPPVPKVFAVPNRRCYRYSKSSIASFF